MRVRFVFRGDRTGLVQRVAEGVSPDEFLYGMPYLDHPSLDVGYVEDRRPYETPAGRFLRPIQQVIGRRYRLGFNLHAYLSNREELATADAIVTTTDSYGLPVLWRKRAGSIAGRVIYISQGLHELAALAVTTWFDERVRILVGSWLRAASAIIVFGEGDATFLRTAFRDLGGLPIHVIQFGVDERFWTPVPLPTTSDGPILSVGSDFLRDYNTLLRAVGDRPTRIVTRLPLDPALVRTNTHIDGNVDDLELRDLYRRCRFVVVPVEATMRDSGHSVALQAMACGKAVILSRTDGLWDPERMRDRESCIFVPPGDATALRSAIEWLERRPNEAIRIGMNARALVESTYTSRQFGQALMECVLSAIA